MSGSENPIESEDEEDELEQHREEVDDEPNGNDRGFQGEHDGEANDISAGQKDDRNCNTAFFNAIAGYHFNDEEEVL